MSALVQLGLVGQHLSYSLSPAIYNELFKLTGVAGEFTCFDCDAPHLREIISRAKGSGFIGLAVTIPHKQAVMDLVDEIDADAEGAGAVNAINFADNCSQGVNTDIFGFSYTLRQFGVHFGPEVNVLILGAGGAASSVAYVLLKEFKFRTVTIMARSRERVEEMRARYAGLAGSRLRLLKTGLTKSNRETFDLIINATPLGGPNAPDANPIPKWADMTNTGTYFDLNYNADNRVVQKMQDRGYRAYDGSTMLVAQAVRNFELWTGHKGEIETVRRAVFGG
ncbi:MAG TPA: shikimate dehydrogenase [Candidatus Acidoferrum sp.]|nr:shikimate dehydrogenase [Candidatus Acidoferrum sp.]